MKKTKAIKDRCEIMYVLLNRTFNSYSNIGKFFKYPMVISSSGLVIINSYFEQNDSSVRLPNIILNSINVLLMAIYNNLNITQKIENMKSKSQDFIELSHEIDADLLCEAISNDKTVSYIQKYDAIMKNTLTDIIQFKKKKEVKEGFKGKKTLPFVINGVLEYIEKASESV